VSMNSSEAVPKSFGNISKSLEEVIRKKNLLEKQLKDNGIEPSKFSLFFFFFFFFFFYFFFFFFFFFINKNKN